MDAYPSRRDQFELDRLASLGQFVRRARQCAGLSQQRLADLSGVSQSVISRVERARAPRLALDRLLAIQAVLGACFPLGVCPHEHGCIWQPRSDTDRLYLRAPGMPADPVRRREEWLERRVFGEDRDREVAGGTPPPVALAD